MKRWQPALVTFLATLAALMPSALTLPQHVDEVEYAYISAYYGGKIARLDFSPVAGSDEMLDPGWSPQTFWALTQPMAPRFIYAAALGLTGSHPPLEPAPRVGSPLDNPLTHLSTRTRDTTRFTAVLLAALGLAMIASRLGWSSVAAILLFLLIPHVRDDLARGWAEGPLLFSFGLTVLAWGTRWFGTACGVAAAFKLTALGLWPLAFWHGLGHSRYRHILGLLSAAATWTVLMPPSWFAGGPSYLVPMLLDRWWEFSHQSGSLDPAQWGGVFGHYLPTRYLWPLELAVLLTACVLAPPLWRRRRIRAAATHAAGVEARAGVSPGGDGVR